MAAKQKRGSGGSRKIGRNKAWCETYRKLGTREKNKRLKIARHLKRFPKDKQASRVLIQADRFR